MKYKKISLSDFRQQNNTKNDYTEYMSYINDMIEKKHDVFIVIRSIVSGKVFIRRIQRSSLGVDINNNPELILDAAIHYPSRTSYAINSQNIDRAMIVVYNEV